MLDLDSDVAVDRNPKTEGERGILQSQVRRVVSFSTLILAYLHARFTPLHVLAALDPAPSFSSSHTLWLTGASE